MGSVARVRGRQGSILTGWDPLGTGWLPQPKPQSWALPPSHLPAQCPHFPASPSDIGVLIGGAMSLLPLQPLIPTGARAPGEGSSATASLLSVSRHIPWEAPNLGVPYCQDSSHHTLYQPETRPFRDMTVTDEAPTFIEPRTPSGVWPVRLPSLPCHIQPVSLTLSWPQLLLLCPGGLTPTVLTAAAVSARLYHTSSCCTTCSFATVPVLGLAGSQLTTTL